MEYELTNSKNAVKLPDGKFLWNCPIRTTYHLVLFGSVPGVTKPKPEGRRSLSLGVSAKAFVLSPCLPKDGLSNWLSFPSSLALVRLAHYRMMQR
jgi:hypothetical protein